MSRAELAQPPPDDWQNRDIAALLADARGGDRVALGHLVGQYCGYLMLIANNDLRRDVQTKLAPSDIVQKTIATAHERIDQFRGTTSDELKRWLRQILCNYILEAHRQFLGSQSRAITRESPITDATAVAVDPNWTPRSCAIRNEEKHLLETAMSQLPDDYQSILRLRNWDELQFSAIGDRLGLSEEAARKLWYRALVRLRKILETQLDLTSTAGRPPRPR